VIFDDDIELLGYGPGWDAYADQAFDLYQQKKKADAEVWMWRYRHEPEFRARARAANSRYWFRKGKHTTAVRMATPEAAAKRRAWHAAYRERNRETIRAAQRRRRAEKAGRPPLTPNQLRAARKAAQKATP